jgi:hypothetical protein
VLVAQDFARTREHVAGNLLRLFWLVPRAEQRGLIERDLERKRVVGAELALRARQDVALDRLGVGELAVFAKHRAEAGAGGEGFACVVAGGGFQQRDGALGVVDRLTSQPQRVIDFRQIVLQRPFDQRLVRKPLRQLRGRLIEHLAYGDLPARRGRGVGGGEHVAEELVDVLGPLPGEAFALKRAASADHADAGSDDPQDQHGQDRDRRADQHFVPLREFSGLIRKGRRADGDRLVRQVPAQVLGKSGGGAIAQSAVGLDRFHHDQIEVAAQAAPQGGRIGAPALRDGSGLSVDPA